MVRRKIKGERMQPCLTPVLMSNISVPGISNACFHTAAGVKVECLEEQCGFVKDKGTRNARTVTERAIEIQKDLYLCFIDYTKAFDKLRHEESMSILDSLNIDGKDLRIVRNIYWEQTAAMRIGNYLSAFQDIKRGVRQGCVLSPDLFSIYTTRSSCEPSKACQV